VEGPARSSTSTANDPAIGYNLHATLARIAVGPPPNQDDGPILVSEMDGVVCPWNGPFTYTRRSTVMGLWSLCASQSACEPTVTASMASSNTCANADDAGLPEAVGDASLFVSEIARRYDGHHRAAVKRY
jgi:hypothetical protein